MAEDAADLERHFSQATAEAQAAFGDGRLYLEKLIRNARHVEVQVLGDGERAVHCYERECSLQRRRQKVWEEAPAASCSMRDTREKLCASAVALAESVRYRGAGTLEYLYDEVSGAFYFIEMNTRIQVEHPVTEMVTGIDLVKEMLKIAGGGRLSITQSGVALSGHAIEVRINAEDPSNNFMPFPGVVDGLELPAGAGVRFDSMLYHGYAIPPFYDSLLGKLIVHGETREAALDRLEVGACRASRSAACRRRSRCTRPWSTIPASGRAGCIHSSSNPGWMPTRSIRRTEAETHEDPIFLRRG